MHNPLPPTDSPPAGRKLRWFKTYRVPRRFTVGKILVVFTAFSILFAGLRWTQLPLLAQALITAFVVVVGLSQVVWPRSPRKASLALGVVAGAILTVYLIGEEAPHGRRGYAEFVLLVILFIPACGALAGYIVGSVCASVFLLIDLVDTWLDPAVQSDAATQVNQQPVPRREPRRRPAKVHRKPAGGNTPRTKTYRVPQRFTVGMILVVSTALSLLFAILRWLDVSTSVQVGVSALVMLAGFSQMLWPARPRTASAVSGAVLFAVLGLIRFYMVRRSSGLEDLLILTFLMLATPAIGAITGAALAYFEGPRRRFPYLAATFGAAVGMFLGGVLYQLVNPDRQIVAANLGMWSLNVFLLPIAGAVFGYLGGNLSASVFLLIDLVDSWLESKPDADEAPEAESSKTGAERQGSGSTE